MAAAAAVRSAKLDPENISFSGCYKCKDIIGDKWVRCRFCSNHAHTKCVYMTGIKSENIPHVNWLCDPCVKELIAIKRFKAEMEEFKNGLKEITSKADKMMQKVDIKLDKIVEFGSKLDEVAGNRRVSAATN